MYLLRLLPVIEPEPKREPLTDDEKAALMPVYLDKQTKRTEQEAVKLRVKILDEYSTAIQKATTERDGMIWLLDHGYNADNVIYYNHTGRFGFGWRSKLSAEVKDKLLDLLCEFQFPYTIEWTGGKIES
jgi:hypothetical protein